MRYKLFQGDCLEVMKKLPDQCIDLVLTDPPYGTTACKWDSVIPLKPMWEQLKRIIKSNSAICLFGSQPFTSILIASNLQMYKCSWIWEKERPSNFFQAKFVPLNSYEDICIFSFGGTNNGSKNPIFYNPQGLKNINIIKKNYNTGGTIGVAHKTSMKDGTFKLTKENFPKKLIKFSAEKGLHPTQKPVALMEYLIKTYTNDNAVVLDFTMGSGTTGVACMNLNRRFIGIELDQKYFDIAKERTDETFSDRSSN